MSDPDAAPDPVDKAYLEAEAVLSDDAARAARRARVLAAVAREGAPEAPAARPRLWRPGGWLVAASVSALAVFLAVQVYRPPIQPPSQPSGAPGVPVSAPHLAAPKATVIAPPPPVQPQDLAPAETAPQAKSATRPPPVVASAPPAEADRGAADGAAGHIMPPSAPPPVALREVPEPAPPPPPPPPSAAGPVAANRTAVPAGSADSAAASKAQDVTVTAERREQHLQRVPLAISAFTGSQRDAADPGAQLRAAAAAGRTTDVEGLLRGDAPVDAADAEGDTALMKSVQADHSAAAALLVRHGASLDKKNRAGRSARDMAKAIGDADLDKALGLVP
jgi:hypothetical protein